jgi:hypothetical protein
MRCCQHVVVVVPELILDSMVGNRGTKMFELNFDDQDDLCAYKEQLNCIPISLQQTPKAL